MDNIADVLLLHATQAWCDECAAEQLLLPVEEEGVTAGLCCTVCDAAVFLLPMPVDEPALRRSA